MSRNNQELSEQTRKTGIDVVGDNPWGSHFCAFYHNTDDLIDILIPYFQMGLENNEFCIWVLPESMNEQDARDALKESLPKLDEYLEQGQLEIIRGDRLFDEIEKPNVGEVAHGWLLREKEAQARGFEGLRLAQDISQISHQDWTGFIDYEAIMDSVINKRRILAMCSYSLDNRNAMDALNIIRDHQSTIIRESGRWQVVSGVGYRREEWFAKMASQLLGLQQAVEVVHKKLDLDIALKKITDSAVHNLGYTVAGVMLRDRERGSYEVASFSTSRSLLSKIRRVVDTSPRDFSVSVNSIFEDDGFSEGLWSLMSGRAVVGQTLAEVIYPIITEEMCSIMQRVCQTKSHIAVPLHYYEAMIGILIIASPIEEVSNEELLYAQCLARVASQAITNNELHKLLRQNSEALKAGQNNPYDVLELERIESEFISHISHELHSPLHSIKGFARLLLEDKVADLKTEREFLSRIDTSSEHLIKLVDEMLDALRLKAHQFRIDRDYISVPALVREVVGEMGVLTDNKNITIKEEFTDIQQGVFADGHRLKQVLINLINNAIKYSNDNSVITVSGRVKGDDYLINVSDQGIGVSAEALPNLFTRFYRADSGSDRGGFGLGLYITKQIIEAHGGEIGVESEPGKGTSVYFTIPLKNDGAAVRKGMLSSVVSARSNDRILPLVE